MSFSDLLHSQDCVCQDKGDKGDKGVSVCHHPLSDVTVAGEAVHPLPHTFHTFLQTISDVMMFLPPGSALQVHVMSHVTRHTSQVMSHHTRHVICHVTCHAQLVTCYFSLQEPNIHGLFISWLTICE